MSYEAAKQCFHDNLDAIREPKSDLKAYKLNQGLYLLAEQIESDLQELKEQIAILLERLPQS